MAKDLIDNKTAELPGHGLKIGYARVSMPTQDIGLQISALEKAGCARIYQETGSGMKSDRPEFAHCLAALRAGDTLVVWKLDRIGRSLRDLVGTVEKLDAENIGLVSLTEPIDTTTAMSRMFVNLIAVLAEFERSLIVERTNAGLAASRAKGRRGGRKAGMNEKDVDAARAMLAVPGTTAGEVAQRLKVSRTTLYKYLAMVADK